MAAHADKLVITNHSALMAKYGAQGVKKLSRALEDLVAADGRRGIVTLVCHIDEERVMHAVGGVAVAAVDDDFGSRNAIHALYRYYHPDYVAILGGPDVVPHVRVTIPGAVDGERQIDSDLPYACETMRGRTVTSFIGVTRAVGRIPDRQGARDATPLIALIHRVATHQPRRRAEFIGTPLVLSAAAWRQSTEESAQLLFGEGGSTVLLGPPLDGDLPRERLRSNIHFINAHGELLSPLFRGDDGRGTSDSYPVVLDGAWLAGNVPEGAVVAAECCYGAALYDPAVADEERGPIANDYLDAGAVAYLGSTSIAYGPAQGNGAADLMARYFLEAVLSGGSTGAALLSARHRFIETEDMENPINTKTLAQFLLLGDPSTMPCERVLQRAKSAIGLSMSSIGNELRSERRSEMLAKGTGLALASIVSKPSKASLDESHRDALRPIFERHKFEPGKSVVFEPAASRAVAMALKVLPGRSFVTVTLERPANPGIARRRGRVMVTKFIHDRPVGATLYEER